MEGINLIHVLLVEQHRLIHPDIEAILAPIETIHLLGAVATAGELRRYYQQGPPPDLLLYSPGIEGLPTTEFFDETRLNWPSVKIAVLLASPEEICARWLMAQGAAGVILKSDAPEQMVEAIDALIQGRVWISAGLTPALIQSDPMPEQTLSKRELAVLQLLVTEKSSVEIAAMLKISERTVRSHLETVYGKLGVTTRVGAAVAAVRRKLVAL
jgi:DNA-binding NarL/FixJ family response regulator